MVRENYFDIAKFLVMLMVISGHLTGNYIVDNGMPLWYSSFNVGLAMPLFFIVSGYFSEKSLSRDVSRIVARIAGFLWPLASFGVVFGIVLYVIGEASVVKMMCYPIVRLIFGSWFLTTLAIIYALVAIVWRISDKGSIRTVVMVVIWILLFFLADQGSILSMMRIGSVREMLPYFIFGIILSRFRIHRIFSISIFCGLCFFVIVFSSGKITTNGLGFYWVPEDWQTVLRTPRLIVCLFVRPFVGIVGSIFLLGILYRLLERFPIVGRLSVFGTTTLGVYVMHEWPIIQINKYCEFKTLCSVWQWPITLMVFFLCHYITLIIKSKKLLNFCFFGDEKWLSKVLGNEKRI